MQVALLKLCLPCLQVLHHKVRLNLLPQVHQRVHSFLQKNECTATTGIIAFIIITFEASFSNC